MTAKKYRRTFWSHILTGTFKVINWLVPWHRLPVALGALNLLAFRDLLREKNLYDTNTHANGDGQPAPAPPHPQAFYTRTDDGTYNSLEDPRMGCAGARFGRNVPLERTYPEEGEALLTPNPRAVSRKLLTREKFIPATTLNLLAAAWIQFQVHDWFAHDNSKTDGDDFRLNFEEDDDWNEKETDPEARKYMRVRRTDEGRDALPRRRGTPAHLPEPQLSLVGRLGRLRLRREDSGGSADEHDDGKLTVDEKRQAADRPRDGHRRHRLHGQLVDRSRAPAHALHARAQRHLRQPQA